MRTLQVMTVVAICLSTTVLQAEDPFLGKWNLDVQRSKYPAGACPRKMTIEMSKEGKGVHYHSETLMTNGKSISADYTANYDGKTVIVMGGRGMLLPVSLKQSSPKIVVATYTSGFQVVATSRRVVSTDNSMMTITTMSLDASGKSRTNIGVYRRMRPAATGTFDLTKTRTDLLASK